MLPVLGGLLLLFFAYLTWKDWPTLRSAWRSRQWKPTEALVVDMSDHSFEFDSVSQHSTATSTRYRETLYTFRYKVDETTFHTTRFSFGGHMDQPGTQFAVGDSVTLYYDPAHPAEAVVQLGLSFSILSAPLIGLVLAALIGWFWRH